MFNENEIKWKKYYLGPEKSTVLIRTGAMGSGKTTAINIFIEKKLGYCNGIFQLIDLDKMVTSSTKYTDGLNKINKNNSINSVDKTKLLSKLWDEVNKDIQGYKLLNTITSHLVNSRRNFSTESTGSFFCPNRKKIIEAYKNGYDALVIFAFLPYYKLNERVRHRALTEGRDVSEQELESNILNALEKSTENLYITNNCYFLNTDVTVNEIPELLLHTQIDFDNKKDFDNCIKVVSYNSKSIQKLINNIETRKDFYYDHNSMSKSMSKSKEKI